MSLFGAANSGVDPQSGAYLTKQQRIAMFRASRGMGGGNSGGSDKAGGVQPKSAIVVANKFATITQTLNNNFQQSATNISDQAQSNKKSIENLYRIISDKRDQELKTEKQETRQTSLDLERTKRQSRENFVEGLSKAAAAAMAPLQKTANAVTGKVMSFWDKLKRLLLLLGGAWLVDNLPEILDSIKSFDLSIDSFSTAVAGILPNVRGIFNIFDGIVRGILKGVRKVASTSFRIAAKIGGTAFRIARKVFDSIIDVTARVSGAIFNGIKKLGSKLFDLYKSAKNTLSGGLKSAQAAKNAKVTKPKGLFGNIVDKLRQGGSKVKSFASNVGGKLGFDKMREGASNFARGLKDNISSFGEKAMGKLNPLQAYATKEGIEKGSKASREKGIRNLLTSVFEKAGIAGGAGKKLLGGIGRILRPLLRFPGVGIAVDIALNKAGGQGNQEALIRGLASGISGMVGMKAGAVIGAGIGTVAIPIPGLGTGIGGILGGLIGSILAANTADALAKAGMTMAGMETTSDETMAANYGNIIENITNNNNTATITPASDNKTTHPDKSIKITPGDRIDAGSFSTPDGMQLSGGLPASTFNLQELPPIMTRMEKEKPEEILPQQEVKPINTRDPQTDIYRQLAGKIYQLTEVGAN